MAKTIIGWVAKITYRRSRCSKSHRQICFRREQGRGELASRAGKFARRAKFSSQLSVLLALQNADHFPKRRAILHPHRRSASARARSDSQGSEMDPQLGREPDRG